MRHENDEQPPDFMQIDHFAHLGEQEIERLKDASVDELWLAYVSETKRDYTESFGQQRYDVQKDGTAYADDGRMLKGAPSFVEFCTYVRDWEL